VLAAPTTLYPARQPMASRAHRLRLLQSNVFEDGLTDSPGAVGFGGGFRGRMDALLQVLSVNVRRPS
jgi:hypothetical protein